MKLPGLRISLARLMAAVAVLAVMMALVVGFQRKTIIESLKSPVAVSGWSASGLCLADGRTVALPGIRVLPTSSLALSEATKRGVELGSDGRVYGLVRLHHWCGNDPVREHIARVDLALLLEYLGEGQAVSPPIPGIIVSAKPGGRFSSSGWDIGEYYEFRVWGRHVIEARRAELGAGQTHATDDESNRAPDSSSPNRWA